MPTIDGNNYTRFKTLTIANTHVGGDLTNFPVPVRITADADIGAMANSDGGDIRFTDESNNLLFAEKVSFSISSGNATGIFWVRIPTLDHDADTVIRCWYGCGSCSSQSGATNVWSEDFEGVWHLGESGSGSVGDYKDSTANGIDSTNTASQPTQTTGVIGYGQKFAGMQRLVFGDSLDLVGLPITMSGWMRLRSSEPETTCALFNKLGGGGGYRLSWLYDEEDEDSALAAYISNGASFETIGVDAPSLDEWHHIVFKQDGLASGWIYVDGVQTSIKTNYTLTHADSDTELSMGYQYLSASCDIDEARISSTVRSADWITAEYYLQKDATDFSWGSEQLISATRCRINNSLAS